MPRARTPLPSAFIPAAAGLLLCAPLAPAAGPEDLAPFFGFEAPRIIVVDEGFGPTAVADIDGDGRMDLISVNNAKSRIEIHRQRAASRTEEEAERLYKVNELPPSPWFDRTLVSVAHRVTAFRVHDVDGDGPLDIMYAGVPAEIVVLRQASPLTFEASSKRRVSGLAAGQDGFEIADVSDSPEPELLALADGKIHVFTLSSAGPVGEPVQLGSGDNIVAFFVEDYNGDGLQDVLAAIPDDAAPLRLWLQSPGTRRSGAKSGVIGPETRFEMPAIIEVEPVRLPDRPGAAICVIERATRRMVLYDLAAQQVEPAASASVAERDATAEVFAFRGGADNARSAVVSDVDADGLLDILATDASTNSVVLYRQTRSMGLGEGRPFSAFKKPKTIAAGQWDEDPELEVFVLSEEERAVGVSQYDPQTGRLGFPQPLTIQTAGASPVAMNFVQLKDGPAVAVVVKDRRDHTLEIHRPGVPQASPIVLEGVNRPPQSIIRGDFNHDGFTDIILFTPSEPMVMVTRLDDPQATSEVLTDKKMPQFGLVQSAGPDNTASLDLDNDGFDELLIADQNFVRACEFDPASGWRVVEQITMPEASSTLAGIDVLTSGASPSIVASDKANKRLVLMSRGQDGAWGVSDRLRLSGFTLGAVRAGSFTGDNAPNLLCLSPDSFAVVRLAGQRLTLEEFAAYRSDEENRLEHESEVGDLNSDGHVDIVVLDAREQMCSIFTVSASRRLYLATEFKVFESRLFSRGDSRQYEPSAAVIGDLSGDGAADLLLMVHDRIMLYPQMIRR